MTHVRARLALFTLVAVCVVGSAAPTQAEAFVGYYNCVNKPSHQWCDGRANGSYDGVHSWDYNQASNASGGSFVVCQQLMNVSTGATLGGWGCFTNVTSNYYGNILCVCYDAEIAQTSGSPKSINGFADAG